MHRVMVHRGLHRFSLCTGIPYDTTYDALPAHRDSLRHPLRGTKSTDTASLERHGGSWGVLRTTSTLPTSVAPSVTTSLPCGSRRWGLHTCPANESSVRKHGVGVEGVGKGEWPKQI